MSPVILVITLCLVTAVVHGGNNPRDHKTVRKNLSNDYFNETSDNHELFQDATTPSRGEDSNKCKDMWTCLKLRMLTNLGDIIDGDDYQLANNLLFERLRHSPRDAGGLSTEDVVNRLRNGSDAALNLALVKMTLDVFRSHKLTWSMLPEVDVTVYRHDGGDGVMDAAVHYPAKSVDASVHPTEIRISISPSSAVELNTTSALANYATEAGIVGRTFGARKRLMMVLLPMMYKMGAMTTLLVTLVVLVLKSITIGIILLVLAFGNLFGKLGWQHHQQQQHGGWTPPQPPVHVHVHVDNAHKGWEEPVEYPGHTAYSRSGWEHPAVTALGKNWGGVAE
uniref:Uncharacterized protein n=1 Tax=Timema bartmani TaxID=61472 RepID=A0A7R9EX42_9NEOP|nr:unnamed protein product [Timema bartmani]